MKVRFFTINPEGISQTSGWILRTQEEVESMYMDYIARNYTVIRVEKTQVIDITEELSDMAWEREAEEFAK